METEIVRRDTAARYDRSVQPDVVPLWSEANQVFDFDLWRYVNMLLVRKYQLVLIFVVFVAVALLVIVNLTPKYTAGATVLIAPDHARVVGIEAATTSLSTSEEAIASEVEVIRSSGLAQRAIAATGFREFLVASAEPPLLDRLLQQGLAVSLWANEALASAWDEPANAASDGPASDTLWDGLVRTGLRVSLRANESLESALQRPAEEPDPRRVLEAFRRQLGVWQISNTNAIRIEFQATDPEIAAAVANELARAYVESQLEVKQEARSRAAELLGERLAALRERVTESDEAVERFRREAGLVRSAGIELVAQQIAEQTSELVEARADLRNIEAQLQEIEALRDARQFGRMYDLLDLAVIHGLRRDVIEAKRRLAREGEELGPRHPSMVELAAEVAVMEARLASEVATAIGGLQSRQAVQLNRAAELERSIAGLEEELADRSGSSGALHKLEAEAEINRTMYATFLGQMQETQQAAFDSPDARVLSPAEVPIDPSFPNRKMLLALAMIAAFCFSSGSVLALEMRFGGALAEAELARGLGLPVLSAIPWARKPGRRRHPRGIVQPRPEPDRKCRRCAEVDHGDLRCGRRRQEPDGVRPGAGGRGPGPAGPRDRLRPAAAGPAGLFRHRALLQRSGRLRADPGLAARALSGSIRPDRRDPGTGQAGRGESAGRPAQPGAARDRRGGEWQVRPRPGRYPACARGLGCAGGCRDGRRDPPGGQMAANADPSRAAGHGCPGEHVGATGRGPAHPGRGAAARSGHGPLSARDLSGARRERQGSRTGHPGP